ncbi:uncharacterized protein MONOS_10074 [Monocercomonoides exilis]|uniref:uncharacterized protein n=1 Tax=Monocercomonoides exilis TaxID=2049356 RepID=UPI003559519F|nr:hypothetical protein MONOS_10074 [Monocercomonoides exilis]|eukprot:MONOS_10074.1-p1 / transcript=MONOS_10074.1 / gene=MONOS_10074 / organism=Monocercomonoides_exilis_PA203 / gene_product=unspecified product / transcript_product=unspecified product / location=Mono_scaffold00442:13219-17861(-) / protein_length=1516 / sequence_SO=supercontig / SO=protein_coding / is_pseudo=false
MMYDYFFIFFVAFLYPHCHIQPTSKYSSHFSCSSLLLFHLDNSTIQLFDPFISVQPYQFIGILDTSSVLTLSNVIINRNLLHNQPLVDNCGKLFISNISLTCGFCNFQKFHGFCNFRNAGSVFLYKSNLHSLHVFSSLLSEGFGGNELVFDCNFRNITTCPKPLHNLSSTFVHSALLSHSYFLSCENVYYGSVLHGINQNLGLYESMNNTFDYCFRKRISNYNLKSNNDYSQRLEILTNLTMFGDTFSGCTAGTDQICSSGGNECNGGALFIVSPEIKSSTIVTITSCGFSGCTANGNGGCIFLKNIDKCLLTKLDVNNCTALGPNSIGGAFCIASILTHLCVRDIFTVNCTALRMGSALSLTDVRSKSELIINARFVSCYCTSTNFGALSLSFTTPSSLPLCSILFRNLSFVNCSTEGSSYDLVIEGYHPFSKDRPIIADSYATRSSGLVYFTIDSSLTSDWIEGNINDIDDKAAQFPPFLGDIPLDERVVIFLTEPLYEPFYKPEYETRDVEFIGKGIDQTTVSMESYLSTDTEGFFTVTNGSLLLSRFKLKAFLTQTYFLTVFLLSVTGSQRAGAMSLDQISIELDENEVNDPSLPLFQWNGGFLSIRYTTLNAAYKYSPIIIYSGASSSAEPNACGTFQFDSCVFSSVEVLPSTPMSSLLYFEAVDVATLPVDSSITNSTFTSCTTNSGQMGGCLMFITTSSTKTTISNCSFTRCLAGGSNGRGGSMYIDATLGQAAGSPCPASFDSSFSVKDVSFNGNAANCGKDMFISLLCLQNYNLSDLIYIDFSSPSYDITNSIMYDEISNPGNPEDLVPILFIKRGSTVFATTKSGVYSNNYGYCGGEDIPCASLSEAIRHCIPFDDLPAGSTTAVLKVDEVVSYGSQIQINNVKVSISPANSISCDVLVSTQFVNKNAFIFDSSVNLDKVNFVFSPTFSLNSAALFYSSGGSLTISSSIFRSNDTLNIPSSFYTIFYLNSGSIELSDIHVQSLALKSFGFFKDLSTTSITNCIADSGVISPASTAYAITINNCSSVAISSCSFNGEQSLVAAQSNVFRKDAFALRLKDNNGIEANVEENGVVCSWNSAFAYLTDSNVELTNTPFIGHSRGAIKVKGGILTVNSWMFRDNNPVIIDYPSARRNIICTGNGQIVVNSIAGGDGLDAAYPSLWINCDTCSVTGNGLPDGVYQKDALQNSYLLSYFVPSVSSSSYKTIGDTIEVTFNGKLLLDCSLHIYIVITGDDGEELTQLASSSLQHVNESIVVVNVPQAQISSVSDNKQVEVSLIYSWQASGAITEFPCVVKKRSLLPDQGGSADDPSPNPNPDSSDPNNLTKGITANSTDPLSNPKLTTIIVISAVIPVIVILAVLVVVVCVVKRRMMQTAQREIDPSPADGKAKELEKDASKKDDQTEMEEFEDLSIKQPSFVIQIKECEMNEKEAESDRANITSQIDDDINPSTPCSEHFLDTEIPQSPDPDQISSFKFFTDSLIMTDDNKASCSMAQEDFAPISENDLMSL